MKNLFYDLKDLARTACQFGLRHGPVSGNTVGERLMLLQYFVSGGTVQIRVFLSGFQLVSGAEQNPSNHQTGLYSYTERTAVKTFIVF